MSIPNYSLVRNDRNRKDGCVACYIRSDICFNNQNYISDEIENNSFHLLFPKAKPISIAIVYKPATDNRLLDYLSKGLNDFNLMEIIIIIIIIIVVAVIIIIIIIIIITIIITTNVYTDCQLKICNICKFCFSIRSCNNYERNKGGCVWSNKVSYFITPLVVGEEIK